MSSNPKNYRMCVVCRKMHPKQDLYRICKDESNTPFVDYLFKVEGRGAYVCKNAECIATLGNKKKVSKSLGGTLPQELIDQMIKETGTI